MRQTETIMGHSTLDRNSSVNISLSQKKRHKDATKHHYQVHNVMSKDRVNSDIFGAHGQLLQIPQLNDNNINETSKHSGSQENNSASKRASTGLDSAQAILAQDLKKRMRVM